MKISEYPEINQLKEDNWLLVETAEGTKRIKKSNIGLDLNIYEWMSDIVPNKSSMKDLIEQCKKGINVFSINPTSSIPSDFITSNDGNLYGTMMIVKSFYSMIIYIDVNGNLFTYGTSLEKWKKMIFTEVNNI